MNKEALLATADRIEKHPDKYDQGEWCGTTCCIAGHAAVASGQLTQEMLEDDSAVLPVTSVAHSFLELTWHEDNVLFGASGAEWPEPFCEEFSALQSIIHLLESQVVQEYIEDCQFDAEHVAMEIISLKQRQAAIAVRFLRALASGEVTLG